MAICGRKCGICGRFSSIENVIGKFGICIECHRKNAVYQGYTGRSGMGPGINKTLNMSPWYALYAEYWTEFLTGWLDCAISYRMGPYGHVALERRNASQKVMQEAYELKHGYNREMRYLPEKPAPKQFRASRI